MAGTAARRPLGGRSRSTAFDSGSSVLTAKGEPVHLFVRPAVERVLLVGLDVQAVLLIDGFVGVVIGLLELVGLVVLVVVVAALQRVAQLADAAADAARRVGQL